MAVDNMYTQFSEEEIIQKLKEYEKPLSHWAHEDELSYIINQLYAKNCNNKSSI